jgi:TolA-binding protein
VIIAQWDHGTLALAVSSIGLLGAAVAAAMGRFNAVNVAAEKERIALVLGDCHARAEKQDQKITALQDQIIALEREIERWKVQSEMTNSRMSKGNT